MNFKFEKASEDVPSAANKKQRCLILENHHKWPSWEEVLGSM